jgi:hypothetical protein
MSSILNKYCHDFDKEVMEWVHEKQAFAFNQVVEVVVNSNPSPFEADPRIVEYIKRMATALKAKAESEAVKAAKCNTMTIFEQNKVMMLGNFDIDLATIRNDCDHQLQDARDKAQLDINAINANCQRHLQDAKDKAVLNVTNLRAKLKAQWEANKADAHDTLIGTLQSSTKKRSQETQCPNPIRTSSRTPSVGSVISNTHVSEINYGEPSALTQEAMMAVDIGGPVAEGNSPTPKADIPLIPAETTNPQISDMMKFMKECMDEQSKHLSMQLEPIIKCIKHLEEPKVDYDNMVPNYTANEYNTWTIPHDDLEYLKVEPIHTVLPPCIDENDIMHDMDNAYATDATTFNAKAEKEEE